MASSGDFEALLEFLKRARGFDFTGYKRPSLLRRIEKRMMTVGVDDFDRYVDYLTGRPGRVHVPFQHDPDKRDGLLP